MSKYTASYLTAIRGILQDENAQAYRWTTPELTNHLSHAIETVSKYCPHERRTGLTTQADSKEIDISYLSDRLRIDKLEYKGSNYNWSEWSDVLTLDISSPLSAVTKEGTLTGTVTFTKGSTAITGSGTLFTTELEAGDYIKKSGGTEWYEIKSIVSAIALTLRWASNDNGADTANLTEYGAFPIVIWWEGLHAVTTNSSTVPLSLEQLIIDGGVAYAAVAWIADGADRIVEAITKITTASTSIGLVTARVTQSIEDLATGRALIGKEITAADAALDNMSGEITASIANLTSGIAFINKCNKGGVGVPTDYANYATGRLQNAASYLNQARGFLGEDQLAGEYPGYAARELQNAAIDLNQAQTYLGEVTAKLNVASIIARFTGWGENRLALFLRDCQSKSKIRTRHTYSAS